MSARRSKWTPEEDARLLELQEQGFSRHRIGKALGRTPGGVKGRVSRMGWGNAETSRPAPAEEAEGAPRRQEAGERPVAGARRERPVLPPARACQYIGETKGNPRDWTVCGKPCVEGRSYCVEHAAICYVGKASRNGAEGVADPGGDNAARVRE